MPSSPPPWRHRDQGRGPPPPLIPPARPGVRLHTGMTFKMLLADPAGKAIIAKYLGGFMLMADMSMVLDMTVEQVASKHPTYIPAEMLQAIGDDLAKT